MKAIGFVFLVGIIIAIVLAVRSSQAESKEGKTIASLPPTVQHAVASMDGPTQAALLNEYYDKRRKSSVGYLLWFIFGTHYLYVKKAGLWIVYFITGGGFGIWALIDLFRMPSIMRDANEQIARQALQTLQIGTSFGATAIISSRSNC